MTAQLVQKNDWTGQHLFRRVAELEAAAEEDRAAEEGTRVRSVLALSRRIAMRSGTLFATAARLRLAQGVFCALGAPMGWLLLRLTVGGIHPFDDIRANPELYFYLTVPTLIAFSVFGYRLGLKEDRLRETNRRLDEMSITDALTGLKNVRYFYNRLKEEIAECARSERPLSVALIDLDHFKRVNDRYGHPVGDQVLTATAAVIASVIRKGETAARVGGEEFAVLLPGSNRDDAHRVGERIRQAVENVRVRLANGRDTVRMTASIGIATAESPVIDMEQLYSMADEALYRAKRRGRNRIVCEAA